MVENILQSAEAYQNCIKSGNSEWENRHWDRVHNTLLETLPHGSGIDCDWCFGVIPNSGNIFARNSYHRMNDNGMYCGYIDFDVIIKHDRRDIGGKLVFKVIGRFGKHQDIKDYLYEIIGESLDSL